MQADAADGEPLWRVERLRREQKPGGGMTYLAWLIEQFRGDLDLALAGYNAGEKAWSSTAGIRRTRRRRSTSAGSVPSTADRSAVTLAAKSDGT